MKGSLLTAARWLAGDLVVFPSRNALLLGVVVSFGSLSYAWRHVAHTIRPLIHAGDPPALPPDHDDIRFGMAPEMRRAIFDAFAEAEPGMRAEGRRSFPGLELAWSAEDHRGALERGKAASLAATFGVTPAQVYLALDEGIREHWETPDGGAPLSPQTVPLNPRRKYGW